MTITSQIPTASRVQLDKAPAEYLVIADDGPAVDDVRAGRTPERRVRYVERRAADPVERQLQWDELEGDCLDAEGTVRLLALTAVSHGHAAHVARREFAAFNAAVRMGDEIDRHLECGERGWLAIRIADGGSDGELYGDYEDAFAAQEQPEACTYFPISPLCPWTPAMCAEHLEFMTHLRHGCMVYGRPTCR
ncbi:MULTISPECIES: hypothetical protein [unclassified Streptomyces]|uniref:hypothetical protein n=1 Tax=unclassified Streptomyces TaxID=2593676 RepID=UPI0038218F76